MQYLTFRETFKNFTVISSADIGSVDAHFHRRRLNEWQDKGYLKKIIKGYYRFSDTALDENILFETANRIYAPSYISLEMAFSYYGFIPEAVYGITSATPRPTRTFDTQAGTFSYQTLKSRLFFGYQIVEYGAQKHFAIASPEKAILDFCYLHPSLTGTEDFIRLRFNWEVIREKVQESVFFEYLDRFGQKALSKRVAAFQGFLNNA
jgi:predicted transcriptional regulator of viral defense system